MSTSPIGLSFRETMKGPIPLGESDPEAGKKAGRRAGTELAMHALVEIDDLDRFLADPEHPGRLSGTVDFAPLGACIPAPRGVFKLFSPGGARDTKLMVYELAFEHGGKPHYLAGQKNVHDDLGLDLWDDTTTLFTRLHEGTSKEGPVVGAGVLTLGVADLVRLISTVEVPGATNARQKAEAVGKFGRAFLGELWDSYIHHLPSFD